MAAMSELGETYRPNVAHAGWHAKRFQVFELLQKAGRAIREDV